MKEGLKLVSSREGTEASGHRCEWQVLVYRGF